MSTYTTMGPGDRGGWHAGLGETKERPEFTASEIDDRVALMQSTMSASDLAQELYCDPVCETLIDLLIQAAVQRKTADLTSIANRLSLRAMSVPRIRERAKKELRGE